MTAPSFEGFFGGVRGGGMTAPTVVWEPQEGPQTALLECPIFEVLFGGARGGGKTEASIGDWLQHSSTYGENAVGVFFRRTMKQLSEVIARTQLLFPKIGAKWNENKAQWTMPGGGRLLFRYLERDSDADEYQGHSYTRIYIEEVCNFPSPVPINKLRACLRSARGVPVGMRLTGNPGGPGHTWVKERYITPDPRGWKVITDDEIIVLDGKEHKVSLSRIFIPSKITDNVMLMKSDPTYILRLRQTGSDALVKAWLDGNWDIVDGAFFDEWDPGLHVIRSDYRNVIPPHSVCFRAFDWGSAKPFSCGWYCVSDGTWPETPNGIKIPPGALVKVQEWYGAKGPNQGLKMNAALVGRGIKERAKDLPFRDRGGWADPAIFTQDGGPSIAEMMSPYIGWLRADNKRVAGWEQMHYRLKGENGVPMLYFLDCCDDSIRTIPTLQHDDTKVEDVDTDGEDHAGDETRYACMSRPWYPKQADKPSSWDPGTARGPEALTITELIARQAKRNRERANS